MIEQSRHWHHVYPINDLKDHLLESLECCCNPEIDWEHGIVVHNAYDLREIDKFLKDK